MRVMDKFKIEIPVKKRLDFIDALSSGGLNATVEPAKKENRYRVTIGSGASISRDELMAVLRTTGGQLIEK